NVPTLDRSIYASAEGLVCGAYVLNPPSEASQRPDIILIATGSEVQHIVGAEPVLATKGIKARLVSMPCWELFEEQPAEYRERVLPSSVTARLAVEAGRSLGWERWVGACGATVSLDRYGASAPRDVVMRAAGWPALGALGQGGFCAPDAVGPRVVHGGPDHTWPQRIDASLPAALRQLIPLAPLHLPSELEVIGSVAAHFPDLPQAACFDTAFHRTMPELAQRLPLPRELWGEGLRRYGFHGLSYEYVVSVLGAAARRRTIIGHLGNGASLVAIQHGRPMDTTMGFTPIGGVIMGTRSADLDPGVLLYLLREKGYDACRLEHLVNEQSGLRGISGTAADMNTLRVRREQDPLPR